MRGSIRLFVSVKPFDGLFAELEKALERGDAEGRGMEGRAADDYLHAIGVVREAMDKLREPGSKHIRKLAGEIEFFRAVWPSFYSQLLLYTWQYKLEIQRELVTGEDWMGLLEAEVRRAVAFFRKHRDFWQYFRSGSPLIDEQFTRAYSRGSLFDPLAVVIDPEFATLASYRAAQGLAYESYLAFLKAELSGPVESSVVPAVPEYEFDGSDAEGQEWLMELHASKVIRKRNGQHLTLSELNRWFKYNFGQEFQKLFDKMNVLRNRKVDPIRYLHKRMRATEQWIDQKNKDQ